MTEVHCDDFLDLGPIDEALRDLDAVCFCLGVSASQVENKREYYRITHDFALAAAGALRAASPEALFHFLSGAGTNLASRMNWARVKAETERDLSELELAGCIHWHPATILADVAPERLLWNQKLSIAIARPLSFLRRVAVGNTAIGEAMLQTTLDGRREGVIENREIRDLSDRYRRQRERT